jgi:hypothetical protein
MDGRRYLLLSLVFAGLLGLSGASCPGRPNLASPVAPALPPTPTLEQIVQVVNANSLQIQSISTNDATLNGPGFPTLRASIALERPRRFRLRAESLLGPEVDLGSNDQLFWFWARLNHPPVVYYCRHDQFETSPARNMLPVRPEWLIEALGMNEFDPNLPHQGPIPVAGGRYEIRTTRPTADGPMTKATIVDGVSGLVVEQHMYDAQGRLVASSIVSRPRRDPLTGVWLPQIVDIRSPSAQFSMQLDLGRAEVNRLAGDPALLWSMPVYGGLQPVDLCNPGLQPAGPVAMPGAGGETNLQRAPNRAWNRLLR